MDGRLDPLDALATVLLVRAAPVQFDRAASRAEQEAAYRLRYDTVVEEGWATAADYPDGLERDEFDERAVHVLGRLGDRLIAVARLAFPEPGRLLPTEREFELTMEPADGVVDIGRAIIVRHYRSAEHTLLGALLARCWLEIRARGFQNLCGAASGPRLERYQQFGLPLRILGPSRRYWGEDRYPVFLNGHEFADFVHAGSTSNLDDGARLWELTMRASTSERYARRSSDSLTKLRTRCRSASRVTYAAASFSSWMMVARAPVGSGVMSIAGWSGETGVGSGATRRRSRLGVWARGPGFSSGRASRNSIPHQAGQARVVAQPKQRHLRDQTQWPERRLLLL
jgi:hypothetical protein